jgi:RNA polymerase sigma-70 factor (ECF subfamily)
MKDKEMDDNELFIIKRMMDGERDAFKHFFDTYYSDLCNFVNLYIKNQYVSEEIVQDIFVHFWENKKILNINTSVKSYLYSATKYKGLNHIRNIKRREEIRSTLKIERETEIAYTDFDDKVLRDILNKATESLPPKCLQIFQLSQDAQLSNKDIANKLGISVKTVENQMTIAYKKLRTFLQPYKEQLFFLFVASFFN